MKSLKENYERNEKIVKIICIISIVGIILGIIFGGLYLIFKKSFLDTIACYLLTISVIPVLFLQVAMPANFHNFGMKSLGITSLFFFLLIFPLANILFLGGINELYGIIPSYYLIIANDTTREIVGIDSAKQFFWTFVVVIYVDLISLGFILGILKKSSKIVLI